MAARATRADVQRLLEEGAQLVEVLPSDEYADEHLPGAISIPLQQLATAAPELLDSSRVTIVYCYDTA